jgi:formylglycine-generating enzyme required for sulfatase activity
MLNEQPRKQLHFILLQYGRSVCQDARRCEALIRDLCPEHELERNLLITALKAGVPQALLNSSAQVAIELTIKTHAQRLHLQLGLAEHFALWAVESWALSLNLLTQPIAQTQRWPSFAPKPKPASLSAQWRDPITGMEFVKIPKGSFMMGSPDDERDRDSNEKLHHVNIPHDFYLSKTLVTQAQWQALMGNNPSHFKGNNLPVEQVSWFDVQHFIAQLNHKTGQQYRLPTEAEWEYACRAGTTTPFFFGDTITPEQVNYDGNYPYGNAKKGLYREKTVAVKSLPPNAWGLYEMHGNVWEWCNDWYGDYPNEPVTNPTGANKGSFRVLRGGSWHGFARYTRSAFRNGRTPDDRDFHFGFRFALVRRMR